MEKMVFSLILIYFAFGAVAVSVINRKKNDALLKGERWMKYFLYLLIVNLIVLAILGELFWAVSIVIATLGFFELCKVCLQTRKTKQHKWVNVLLSMFVFVLLIAGFIWFSFLKSMEDQLFVYMLVFIFDGFSQITGQLIGKHKFVPKISPEKTLEGSLGGLTVSLLTGFLLKDFMHFSTLKAIGLSFAICCFAFAGDLLASRYKRLCGVKDFSQLIPGHGGIMDRFDSFIAAGALYTLITLF